MWCFALYFRQCLSFECSFFCCSLAILSTSPFFSGRLDAHEPIKWHYLNCEPSKLLCLISIYVMARQSRAHTHKKIFLIYVYGSSFICVHVKSGWILCNIVELSSNEAASLLIWPHSLNGAGFFWPVRILNGEREKGRKRPLNMVKKWNHTDNFLDCHLRTCHNMRIMC